MRRKTSPGAGGEDILWMAEVSYGSKGDIDWRRDYVCFSPDIGHQRPGAQGPLRATSRHPLSSFNHLVCAAEQRRRNGKTERLAGFEVNNQFELRGECNGKVGRLAALQNLVDVVGGIAPLRIVIGRIRCK